MKTRRVLFLLALLSGCAHTSTQDFVQGNIRITPPIQKDSTTAYMALEDGGTQPGRFTDAKGRSFDYYIDHRIGTATKGAIYLNAYPGKPESIRVKDVAEFKQKLGF